MSFSGKWLGLEIMYGNSTMKPLIYTINIS
jgi:hypothetical protein